MTAGRRDTLIELQRYTATQDAYGEEVATWAAIGTEWADIYYGKGSERREAAKEQGEQPATFEVLANALTIALKPIDRINLGGVLWDIHSVSPDTPRRGLVSIEAKRAA